MIALFLAACVAQQRIETDAGCAKCHEGQLDDWRGSVHERNAVGCIKCHGSDAVDNKSKPHLFMPGFRRGVKKTNPKLCAECHKAEFESFDKGAHGEDTRDEEGKVKGCSSCHEFHSTPAAERRAIFKEKCSKCHKSGSQQVKWAERYAAVAERLEGDELKYARVWQHSAADKYRVKVDPPVIPPQPAYNTKDAGPPWGVAAAAVATLGVGLAWILRGQGRRAS